VSRTIVLVDDDTLTTQLYKNGLVQAGFTVYEAADGAEALRIVQQAEPDLVLLDLVMPGIDGFEVLKTIKGDPKLQHIPVVILSNLSRDADEERARALGATDFIVKANVLPRVLVARLVKLLGELPETSEA
jgi:CheY-like chemotaxis protein